MSRLAAVFDEQPPLEHDILADRQDELFERRTHLVRKPIVQLRATAGIGDQLNPEPDFSESDALHHGLGVFTCDVSDYQKARASVLNPWLDAEPTSGV